MEINAEFAEDGKLWPIFDEIDQRVENARQSYQRWPCRKGCAACCQRLARLPEITFAEWQLLHRRIMRLPTAVEDNISRKVQALPEEESILSGFVTCPLLDEDRGECQVYDHRPAVCRMYGYYVSRYGNQWRKEIQELHDLGELDGVILGNQGAIKGELAKRFGENKSIKMWYRET